MLKLAELLCLAGVHVTFLNTKHNHQRLLRSAANGDVESRFDRYPGSFRFEVISDGFPEDHPRSVEDFLDVVNSLQTVAEPHLREVLLRPPESGRKVTCAVVEAVFSYVFEIGKEVGVPVFAFETISPCCLGVYLCIPKLFQDGKLPLIKDLGEDLETVVDVVAGMEGVLKVRDLPEFCRTEGPRAEKSRKLAMAEIHSLSKLAHGLILNSFEELEGPILPHIRTHFPGNTYMIGPVQQHLKTRLAEREITQSPSSNSFWREDNTCIQWLDEQPDESVIYVSFGSLNTLTMAQLMEVWHGLVASAVRFLWVLRPDIVKDNLSSDQNLVTELRKGCSENGQIVSWAPQEEVLAHRAIGGFWTHSGWNSTLESIIAGKPMICSAQIVDQLITRRVVSEVWKIGVDMEDKCDRLSIEKMVKEVMGSRGQELKKSAQKFSKLARESVNNGGSSYTNLDHLINEIRRLSS
uniref:Uncharacterized glucosyltransferase 2 n=1 Tax=Ipomoea nil TaxID=35883 RepID=K4PW94_IPONI|nr:uncharacterized glucosyltransferase 2 [Ipomoea nil]